jgi:CheY-like chemotaxis protein
VSESWRRAPLRFFDRPVIVVAEDDYEMRQVLWNRLTGAGYRVREAADGIEALERVHGGRRLGPGSAPAAVVADVRMAGMGGLELLERLRALDPRLPVILITAFGDPETHEAARRLGAVASFDKPLVIARLLAALARVAPPPVPASAERD